jgi:hypothetical protein
VSDDAGRMKKVSGSAIKSQHVIDLIELFSQPWPSVPNQVPKVICFPAAPVF